MMEIEQDGSEAAMPNDVADNHLTNQLKSSVETERVSTQDPPKATKARTSKRRINVAAKSVSKSLKKTTGSKAKTKQQANSNEEPDKQQPVDPGRELGSTSNGDNIPDSIVLKEWRLIKARTGNKLANYEYWIIVEGLRVMSDEKERVWHSSLIAERIDQTTLKTFSGSIYRLSGPISLQGMTDAGFSEDFANLFREGFPEEWKSWICVEFDGELSSEMKYKAQMQKRNLEERKKSEKADSTTTLSEIANISTEPENDHSEYNNQSIEFSYDDHLKITLDEVLPEEGHPETTEKPPDNAPRRSGRKPKPRINLVAKSRTRKSAKKDPPKSEEIQSFDALLDKQIVVPQEEKPVSKTSLRKLKMKLSKTAVQESHTSGKRASDLSERDVHIASHSESTSSNGSITNAIEAHPKTPARRVTKETHPEDKKHNEIASEKRGDKEKEPPSESGLTRSGRSVRKPREYWIVEENDHSHTPSKRARRTSEKPTKVKRKPGPARKRKA
ncbi:santa-domain-containing protein [Basidiobolus meristosporus CBS 931.73]|uniref:Santa-domain-containing protein n=1 Tax=Basidiobolus meristosporus CBS 931.73 TaxID=1314790 RepID=A0A1Y1XN43_9FUNG|nr:santa-domain-containing protein [Basidiobolus meristosporus CBS 931.73]|eukprot:ORX87177.1 santa-domain-containing protein [Basidiobolus meristosporus CBS 931.73]